MFAFYYTCVIGVLGVDLAATINSYHTIRPRAKLFEFADATGDSLEMIASEVPLLEAYGFNDKAQAVCLRGTWIFYKDVLFNGDEPKQVEYYYRPETACLEFKIMSGQVSSVRFAGHPLDLTQDSITFYEGPTFQGDNELVHRDNPSLLSFNQPQSSFIITGQLPWTLYDGLDFEGESICVFPPISSNQYPAFITDMEELTIPIPYGTVASVKKGCFSKTITAKP